MFPFIISQIFASGFAEHLPHQVHFIAVQQPFHHDFRRGQMPAVAPFLLLFTPFHQRVAVTGGDDLIHGIFFEIVVKYLQYRFKRQGFTSCSSA